MFIVVGGRRSGLMVSALDSGVNAPVSGFKPWLGTLYCVLGQDT